MLKNLIFSSIFFISSAIGATLQIENGWQLLGSSNNLAIDNFKQSDIKILWLYDANLQRWSAFSNIKSIQKSIENTQGIGTVKSIKEYSGFWILADKKSSLELSLKANYDNITLKKGWQLLGSNSSFTNLYPFTKRGIKIVWSYNNKTKQWEAFSPIDSIQQKIEKSKKISPLKSLSANSGFWILADKEITLSIFSTAKSIKDSYPDFMVAKDNTLNELSKEFDNFTIKVTTNQIIKDTSRGSVAIFGMINNKNTNALLKLNSNYKKGTFFVVKVYQGEKLVGISKKLAYDGRGLLDFGSITIEPANKQ